MVRDDYCFSRPRPYIYSCHAARGAVSPPRALLGFGDGVLEIDERKRSRSLNMQRTVENPLRAGMTTVVGRVTAEPVRPLPPYTSHPIIHSIAVDLYPIVSVTFCPVDRLKLTRIFFRGRPHRRPPQPVYIVEIHQPSLSPFSLALDRLYLSCVRTTRKFLLEIDRT